MAGEHLFQLKQRYAIDFIFLVALLLCGLKFTYGIESFVDLGLYDETSYLAKGIHFFEQQPAAPYGPLYAAWYSFLHFFQHDPIALYYLNFKLMTILPSLFIYIFLRAYQISFRLSFFLSALFLISQCNFTAYPKVSHFGLILILSMFVIIQILNSPPMKIAVAGLFSALIVYVRPEYLLTTILFCLLFVFIVIRTFHTLRAQTKIGLGLIALGTCGLFLLFGNPWDPERSFIAFTGGYAENWVKWNHESIQPLTNSFEIARRDFGEVHSITDAVIASPKSFLKHIAYDSGVALREFLLMMFPATIPMDRFSRIFLILLIAGFACKSSTKSGWTRLNWSWLYLLFFAIPTAITVIMISPRQRYLLIAGIPAILFACVALWSRQNGSLRLWKAAVISLFAFSLTPIAGKFFTLNFDDRTDNVRTIQFIHSLSLKSPIDLLAADGSYDIYLGKNFHSIAEYEKNSGWRTFRQARSIDLIVVTESLKRDIRFVSDPEWSDFLSNYETDQFSQLAISGTDRFLFIKNELIQHQVAR